MKTAPRISAVSFSPGFCFHVTFIVYHVLSSVAFSPALSRLSPIATVEGSLIVNSLSFLPTSLASN